MKNFSKTSLLYYHDYSFFSHFYLTKDQGKSQILLSFHYLISAGFFIFGGVFARM